MDTAAGDEPGTIDELDHVLFVYVATAVGSVARLETRDCTGERLCWEPRALALSYVDPYVDLTGRVQAYAAFDLRTLGACDWRLAPTNVWKVERVLLDIPHRRLRTSDRRFAECGPDISRSRRRIRIKPIDYEGRTSGRRFRRSSASLARPGRREHAR